MGKVYIATCAFNAEKTLERCVDSVLNQTFTDFIYYLCDNASTDRTGELIKQYADQDSRIVMSHNEINRDWSNNDEYALLPQRIPEEDYFCILDADDELDLDFFKEMIEFLQKNNLDLAVCSNSFIDSATGKLIGTRKINCELILKDTSDFSNYFPCYHQFMRTGWGKLYTGKIARQTCFYTNRPSGFPTAYGGDTYNVFKCLRMAKRVGVHSKILYRYYMSPNSISYQFHPQRIECDNILYDDAVDFLTTKYGTVSKENEDFLLCIYLNALKDTINVLLNAQISADEKLNGIIEIFANERTKRLAARNNLGSYIGQSSSLYEQRNQLFAIVARWLLAVEEVPEEKAEAFCDIGEFVCAASEIAEGWIYFNKLRVSIFIGQRRLNEAKEKLEELEELLPKDNDVIELRKLVNM